MSYSRQGFWSKPRHRKIEEIALSEAIRRRNVFYIESRICIKGLRWVVYWELVPGSRGEWPQRLKLERIKHQNTAVSQRNSHWRSEKIKAFIDHPLSPTGVGLIQWSWAQLPYIPGYARISADKLPPASHVQCLRRFKVVSVHAWDKMLSVPDELRPT